MPSDRQTRRQRHQAAIKPQRGKAIRGAQSTEFVKNSGYRKSEFIGGKKYYTPMSTDPKSSGAGGDVTNITLSGSSAASAATVDNVGVFSLQTSLPITGGHISPITDSGVISIQDYDPIGAAASGLSSKGVISSDTVYDSGTPGTFVTHFLRKDGVWADVSASLDSFKTWSWTGNISNNTPFTTVADSSADVITVTAGTGIQFTDGSSGDTDAITIASTIPDLTSNGTGTVHANNYSVPYYTSAISNATSSSRGLAHEPYYTAAIPEYDPVGGDHTGLVTTGHTYDGGNPTANNFTTHFLRKDGVFSNPAASVLAFKILSWVPSSGTPFTTTADATDDTLIINAGTGINVSLNSADNVTITNTVTDTTYSVGDGGLTQKNFTTTLKSKLDAIESSATADQSNTEIRNAVEAASDSNTFTDADHTKLNGIEASADVTDSTNVNAAGAIMHTDIADSDTGFVVRSGAAAYDIDATDYIQTGANTLSDSSGYAGLYHSADASELKFYTIKAGDNIILTKNNAVNEADTYLEISASDAPTANRFTGILDDGVTTYTATNATNTLKLSGGTGINTSAAQAGAIVTVTMTADIGTGASQSAAGDHTHSSYLTSSHTNAASAHHTKYTDSNATNAMGSKGDSNALNHDKYTNTNAVSAMGSKGNSNALNHDRYTNSEAVAAQPDYDPVGGIHSGVVQTSDTYSGGNPSANNFITYFLRKDGGWANPLGSINAFKTISWVPSSGTPFTTVADAVDDTLTITAGTAMQVALTAADHVTISANVGTGSTEVAAGNHTHSYDNFSSWTIGGDSGSSGVGSGQTATIAGSAPISTAESGRTVTVSLDSDGVTDTHLAYNTGQHLTTSSTPTFGGATLSGELNFSSSTGSVLINHEVSAADAWIFRENAGNWGLYWKNEGANHKAFGGYTTVGAEFVGMKNGSISNAVHINSAWGGTDSDTYATWMLSNYSGVFWCASHIYSEADVYAYYSSDPILKENKVLIENPLDKISKLGGYTFDWKESAKEHGGHLTGHDYGVMADEVEDIFPEMVQTRGDGIRAVKYEKLIPVLIEAVKELKGELDAIKHSI